MITLYVSVLLHGLHQTIQSESVILFMGKGEICRANLHVYVHSVHPFGTYKLNTEEWP